MEQWRGRRMRRRRLEIMIIDLLKEEGSMTTNEIYETIADISFHGATKNQLSNILGRSPDIEKKGFVNSRSKGRCRNAIWGLKNAN